MDIARLMSKMTHNESKDDPAILEKPSEMGDAIKNDASEELNRMIWLKKISCNALHRVQTFGVRRYFFPTIISELSCQDVNKKKTRSLSQESSYLRRKPAGKVSSWRSNKQL